MAVSTVQTALESFTLSQTCTNIWTEQYACPLCRGDATPLCLGTCNEVLIGCLSPLNQAITQLNIFKDFAVGKLYYNIIISACSINCMQKRKATI